MKFYIYYNPRIAKKVIRDLKIKGTDPLYANDPYEFAPIVLPYEEGDDYATSRPDMVEMVKSISSKNFRVICGSTVLDDVLLWSHYAMGHTGIAIEYDVLKAPFGITPAEFKGNVRYINSRPKYFIKENMPDNLHNEQFLNMSFNKALNWKYEKEYRFMISTDRIDRYGLIDLDPKSIKTVIFGFYCPQSVIRPIMNHLNREVLQHVEVSFIELISNQYKLNIHTTTKEDIVKIMDDRLKSMRARKIRIINTKIASFLFCIKKIFFQSLKPFRNCCHRIKNLFCK